MHSFVHRSTIEVYHPAKMKLLISETICNTVDT